MSFFDDVAGPQGQDRRSAGSRVVLSVLLGVFLLLAGAYAALVIYAGDVAPRNATVEGVEIGGQTAQEAATSLRQQLGPQLRQPVVLTHDGRKVRVIPAEAGMSIDYVDTVREAGIGRTWHPLRLWEHYTRSTDTQVVMNIDEGMLTAELDRLTKRFGSLAVEGTIEFRDGRAVPILGRPGERVDREATVDLLRRAAFDPIEGELPVETRQPYITKAAVERAMTRFGRPAMSAPVVIRIGPRTVIAPPAIVGRALTMVPNEGELRPSLDGELLLKLLRPRMAATIGEKPRSASVRVVDGELVTRKARIGAAYDVTELEEGLPRALTNPVGKRALRLKAAIEEPARGDRVVRSWGITERVGGFEVSLRSVDIETRRGIGRLHNTRIPAGESFSFNEAVEGARAPVVGAALFNAAWQLGLPIEEHAAPESRDRRFPPGMDVTVDVDHDLRLTNDTPYSVLVSAERSGNTLVVGLWSTAHHDVKVTRGRPTNLVPPPTTRDTSRGCEERPGAAGYTVRVTRVVGSSGEAPRRDRLVATYPPVERVIC